MPVMQWDLFCRVIDNHGDVGICWRLAADLASRGERVRLWIDDASALSWMAPAGILAVKVLPWPVDLGTTWSDAPPDRVIEAFGCELPAACVMQMAAMPRPPVWINLEYLSAEGFVERSHGLHSPQPGSAGAGLRKWFFYPGFTLKTGGLIREPDLLARQRAFDAGAWLARRQIGPEPGERVVSLFCYEQPALDALLVQLAETPTLLLVTPGFATHQIWDRLGPGLHRGGLRAVLLPWLTQPAYDELLWACDLNFVRGEDSFVRAQFAGKPFVWQPYPQQDGAHLKKLDAFLDLLLAAGDAPMSAWADASLTLPLRRLTHAWAGAGVALPTLPPTAAWARACEHWRDALLAQSDLVTRLLRFASEAG